VYVDWAYDTGEFRNLGNGRWEEWIKGRKVFSFVEQGRGKDGSVTLYDASRGIKVVLTSSEFRVYEGTRFAFKKSGQYVR
jgi:hypothetical protein